MAKPLGREVRKKELQAANRTEGRKKRLENELPNPASSNSLICKSPLDSLPRYAPEARIEEKQDRAISSPAEAISSD